jgi:hypothetical protein
MSPPCSAERKNRTSHILTLVYCFSYSWILNTEATCSSETCVRVPWYQTLPFWHYFCQLLSWLSLVIMLCCLVSKEGSSVEFWRSQSFLTNPVLLLTDLNSNIISPLRSYRLFALVVETNFSCSNWSSHSGRSECCHLLGYSSVYSVCD